VRDLLTANDYEMTEAENGEEAIAAVVKYRPDLILMDVQLPIMDGYEATRRIKADPSLRSIPIIAVRSYALSGDDEKARAAGCNDFVPKPYSPPASGEDSGIFAIECDCKTGGHSSHALLISGAVMSVAFQRPAGSRWWGPASEVVRTRAGEN
jgi:two-component system, cell cycle response regulator DivK